MIITSLIISLVVIAIHLTFQEGEIFEFVSRWGKTHIHGKWQKPVFACPKCMSFWYGIPIYIIAHKLGFEHFEDSRWYYVLFILILTIGMTTAIVNLKQK
jgi:hypothetical protein